MKLNLSLIEPVAIGDGSPVTATPGVARTYWDKNGVLQSVTDGSLRFTYDPSDLSAAPYPLIEAAATNLILTSSDFSSGYWHRDAVGTGVTPVVSSAGAGSAPDRVSTAQRVTMSRSSAGTADDYSLVYQSITNDGVAAKAGSIFLKSATGLPQNVLIYGSEPVGVIVTVTASWQRFDLPGAGFAFLFGTRGGVGAYYTGGDASLDILAWGAQLETGDKATSYIATAGATVTRPADVLGPNAGLIFSTLAENDADDAPLYDAAHTYAAGDRVRRAETHRVYESNVAGNLGNTPELNATGDAAKWLDLRPTNKWAMFDGDTSTQSAAPSALTVVLRPGAINALYGAGIDADQVQVCVQDAPGGNIILNYTEALEASQPGDYDEYFWGRFKPKTDFLVTGIDQYHQCVVTVTLTKTAGTVKCGVLLAGDQIPLAASQRGAKAKPRSYSYIKTDDFGNTTIKRRRATTDLSGTAWVERAEASWVEGVIQSVLDVPVVVIVSDDAQDYGLRGYGLLSAEISWDFPQDCQLSFSLQGLINATTDTAA